MSALALLIVTLSAYVGFAKSREGTDPTRCIGEAVLYASLLILFLGAALWLAGADHSETAEYVFGVLGLAFLTALLGCFTGTFAPRREPIAHW